jgi:hypothetical protein
MKRTILFALLSLLLSGCTTSTVTRVREDGAKEVIVTKGLSDRAAGISLIVGDRLLDAYLPPRIDRASK